MSREIKFRAWDGTQWYVPILADGKTFRSARHFEDYNYALYDTVVEYTGLKDKNGKEIYEGDILSVTDEVVTLGGTKTGKIATTLYEIVWHVDGWATRCVRSQYGTVGFVWGGIHIQASRGEVIGNVYENPDILNSGGQTHHAKI